MDALDEQVARAIHPALWTWMDANAPAAKIEDLPVKQKSLSQAKEVIRMVRRALIRGRK